MNKLTLQRALTATLGAGVAAVLVVIPFHAFLTVWLSQLVGHYTLLRLWKEILLVLLVAAALTLVVITSAVRERLVRSRLFWAMAAFGLVQIVWGIAALLLRQVMFRALGYGWIVDTRYLLFFFVAWVAGLAGLQIERRWAKSVFIPATIVILISLLQYFVLPYDVLRHFGYGSGTIFPYEDINSNIHYLRIMSTLRGANPLGAYVALILIIGVAALLPRLRAWQKRDVKRLMLAVAFLLAGLATLLLTFSRGAWLGLIAGLLAAAVLMFRQRLMRRAVGVSAGVVVVLVVGALVVLRGNITVQNVLLHTQDNSSVASTSNQGHVSAVQAGLHDIAHEPLGRGPGTAGPASVYNGSHGIRIAENYFIQIAQETGWIGLGLFLVMNGLVGYTLWLRRQHVLALGLLAGLIGLSVVNLFSHAWADDTLAYLWWGLAGLAYALPVSQTQENRD